MLTALGLAAAAGVVGGAASMLHPWWMPYGDGVWRGPREGNRVALTFDDGPHPEYTPRVAEILERHRVPATFFCVGRRLERQIDLGRALLAAGHELANHTYRHDVGSDLFSAPHLSRDLRLCQRVLHEVGVSSPFYRPAVGIRNPVVHLAARQRGLTIVTWSLSARDGALPLSARRARWLGRLARPGYILALHDGGSTQTRSALREQTVKNLPVLLDTLAERGLELVTLGSLLAL